MQRRLSMDTKDQSDFLSRFLVRYRAIRATPASKRQRLRGYMQALCLLVLLPFGIIAVKICQKLQIPVGKYFPILTGLLILCGRGAGLFLAKRIERNHPF